MRTKYKYLLGFIVFFVIIWYSKETNTNYRFTTQLKLISKVLELDTITQNSCNKYNFRVVKINNNPLLISKIETSTKNINIQETLQYYPKEDTISISFVFSSKNLTGKINESITIHGNFPAEQITIPISGYVE